MANDQSGIPDDGFEWTFSVDGDGLTACTTGGVAAIDGDPAGRSLASSLPPLAAGYRRERIEIAIDPDGRSARYRVVDREQHRPTRSESRG